jgi:uncharacterized membrane protein
MRPEIFVALFWLLFAISHTVPSSATLRPKLIDKLGAGPFMGLYSLVSFAFFVPLVWVYFRNRHAGELFYARAPQAYRIAFVLAFIGLTLLVASVFRPSPVSLGGKPEAKGLIRITRHPLFLSMGLLGCAHLLLFGFASDVAFFGGLVAYSIFGSLHQDHRQRLTRPELKEVFDTTSWLPFGAILSGRNRLVLSELPWIGFVVGAVAAFGVWRLHVWLLGG